MTSASKSSGGFKHNKDVPMSSMKRFISIDFSQFPVNYLLSSGFRTFSGEMANYYSMVREQRAHVRWSSYNAVRGTSDSRGMEIIKQSTQHPCSHLSDQINLHIDNSETDLSKVSSRLLYNAFKKRKQVPPSAQKKMNEKFPELSSS